jgi:sec-independent protein translocase protein TatB
MFNIGGGELIVILLIALIVLGPQRLPDAARQLGKAMGDLRRLSSGFQNEMKQALETADDPTRVANRRNVLAREVVEPAEPMGEDEAGPSEGTDAEPPAEATVEPEPPIDAPVATPDEPEVTDPVADSIAAVSAQPSAPAKQTPPAAEARAAAKKQAPSDVPEATGPRTTP